MSATSEANSLGSFFALGVQSALNTPATTLYKALATVSGMSPSFRDREAPVEHPSPSGSALNTRRKSSTKHPNYMGGAKATFLLRPKFIVPAFVAAGFNFVSSGSGPSYTHTGTLATGALHKWLTAAWNVDETDGAFVTRLSDARATALGLSVSPEQIQASLTMSGLTLAPMSGSPTYVSEVADEIVPWRGARTTLTINGYSVVERVRGIEFNVDNTLREDDNAIWEPNLVGLGQQSIDISMAFSGVNISDDIAEALWYGASGGTAVDTSPATGAISVRWESEDNIPSETVPYSLSIAIPSVEWMADPDSFEANGDAFIAPSMTAYMLDGGGAPITVTVVNDVASY